MGSSAAGKLDRATGQGTALPGYVCPDCKAPLERLRCPGCGFDFPRVAGIPRLLSRDPRFERVETIAAAYDRIYDVQSEVWQPQGRTPEFIRYFSSLLDRFPGGRFLEIGCGEGILLVTRRNAEKFAVDLSVSAIGKASAKTDAHFSLALAERLPFPADHFDLVTSVGVMEHFLDTGEALREIRRILKPGGHYVSLTHVELTFRDRLTRRFGEFVFPRPRPVRLARWLKKSIKGRLARNRQKFVKQPIQNHNTTRGAKARLAKSGFTVIQVLHTGKYPDLPLIGPYVVIYVARKPL
jgi:SAM-dependent methyltransferase